MTMEVRNLLSQAMLDMPGCGSKNSTPRRPNPVVALTPPPHKPKELLQLVNTSSHASTVMAEAFILRTLGLSSCTRVTKETIKT